MVLQTLFRRCGFFVAFLILFWSVGAFAENDPPSYLLSSITPTATATVLPTEVPGNSSGSIVSSAGAAEATVKPTLSPTPTIMATLPASITPKTTATPTSTPTATPTRDPGTVEIAVSADGSPLSGALVYFFGAENLAIGTCVTEANGRCSVSGLSPGIDIEAAVQKTGITFDIDRFRVSSQYTASAQGRRIQVNQKNCIAKDIAEKIHEAAVLARTLERETREDLDKLAPSARLVLPAGVSVSALKLTERVRLQLNSYLSNSQGLPEIVFNCVNIPGCYNVHHESLKKTMIAELSNLRRESLLVNRLLRLRDKRENAISVLKERDIVRINSEARRIVNRIAPITGRCF